MMAKNISGNQTNFGKFIRQLVTGMIVGGVSVAAMMMLFEPAKATALAVSPIILGGIGLMYLMMGGFVGFSLAAPGVGSKLINVEDREELIEQRPILLSSAILSAAIGGGLMLLAYVALNGAAGPVTGVVAFAIFAGILTLSAIASIRLWPRYDELMKRLTMDASAWMGGLLFAVLALWGGAAGVGLMAAPTGLDLVSLGFGIMLLSSFIATARLGMLMPR